VYLLTFLPLAVVITLLPKDYQTTTIFVLLGQGAHAYMSGITSSPKETL
jgi:hypothetical protein